MSVRRTRKHQPVPKRNRTAAARVVAAVPPDRWSEFDQLKADFDALNAVAMRWHNMWDVNNIPYVKNSVVENDLWLWVANKQTNEEPTLTPVGENLWILDESDPGWSTNSQTGTYIITGIEVQTGNVPLVSRSLRVYIPPGQVGPSHEYQVYSQDLTDPDNVETEILLTFIPLTGGWQNVPGGSALVPAQSKVLVGLLHRNLTGNVTVNANYDYSSSNQEYTPLSGEAHRRLNRTWVRFHKTDDDGNAGILDGVVPGATIDTSLSSWTVLDITDGGTYWEYEITGTGDPLPGVVAFTFQYESGNPTQGYYENPDYWLASGVFPLGVTARGYFNLSGVESYDDTAYGINFDLQEISLPADWDIAANITL